MDDTLFLEKDYVLSGLKAVGTWVLNNYNEENFVEVAWDLFSSGERGHIFNRTLEQLNIRVNNEIIHQCVLEYRTHKPKIKLLSDSKNLLRKIKGTIGTGLITDGPQISQINKIQALGLKKLVKKIVVTDQYDPSWTKPSAKPYILQMETFSNTPKDFIYIGDNPYKDFISPLNLGWEVLRVRRPESLHFEVENFQPNIPTVSSLSDEEIANVPFFEGITKS